MDLYLECFSGISGNMFIGAMIDLGVPFDYLKKELNKLNLGEYDLICERRIKNGIDANYFNVILPEEKSDHHHEHDHDHENEHHNEHIHDHNHDQDHNHEHNHHDHDHHGFHRNLSQITEIIDNSSLSSFVKEKAKEIFLHIAKAEAKIHGKGINEVHFHEVGAIDSIIDACGAALCIEYLKIEKIYAGTVYTGNGFVNIAHGKFPVPVPATIEILSNTNLTTAKSSVIGELVTPTGAAILKTFSEPFKGNLKTFKTGYGSGSKDFEIPNVLRASLIEISENEKNISCKKIIETNIDDSTGEELGFASEKLFEIGALDVWYSPIYMKKNRPAYKLSCLVDPELVEKAAYIILKYTSSIGVRILEAQRIEMKRDFSKIAVKDGEITVKHLSYKDISKKSFEYEDLKKISIKTGKSIRKIKEEI